MDRFRDFDENTRVVETVRSFKHLGEPSDVTWFVNPKWRNTDPRKFMSKVQRLLTSG